MKNNSLIQFKESIFTKIKNFFKNIFGRNREINQKVSIANEKLQVNNTEKNEKEEFFDLYNKIKKGEIDLYSLEDDKLKKIYAILQEECKLKENLITDTKEKIEKHKKNIKYYNNIA